ncbi:piggyBac transposable element-derived protein 1-like [Sitophilus oryzae]|uniref:PiggyBac transposable element-derived protein 1-like n=1 Tax=Sitophilus oryzae TaxID=7048 RepID=A0A6J2Y272_SITOR|nr:piggyBac transposable element-derived protein 1-like [Sitophilus oryzae]
MIYGAPILQHQSYSKWLCLSMKRFYLLLQALRFDNISTRAERKKIDKLAPIRDIFEKFQERCQACYTPSENCTIDEMLEGVRGRCSFRQYISSKPNKYGIKIFALADSRAFYTLKMEIYAGKQPEGPFCIDNSPACVVKRMCEPIWNSGRNLTCDNWFTSVPLAEDLKKNEITLVGTIRKNKREIPEIFVATKQRPVCSSMFAFGRESLLVSYVPKKNKNVLLLSTLHEYDEIDAESGEACKPAVVTFYNQTKSGVDSVDQLKSLYSVARNTCRWLTVFFSIMNIAGINGNIIFRTNVLDSNQPRREYLKNLARQLVTPHMQGRASQNLPFLLRLQIKNS